MLEKINRLLELPIYELYDYLDGIEIIKYANDYYNKGKGFLLDSEYDNIYNQCKIFEKYNPDKKSDISPIGKFNR